MTNVRSVSYQLWIAISIREEELTMQSIVDVDTCTHLGLLLSLVLFRILEDTFW